MTIKLEPSTNLKITKTSLVGPAVYKLEAKHDNHLGYKVNV